MIKASESDVLKIVPDASDICLLKEGGQKIAFSALSANYGPIAVKFMLPQHEHVGEERIVREVEIISTHCFKNVPQIHVFNWLKIGQEPCFYIIEQLIVGQPLSALLQAPRPLPYKLAIDLIHTLLKIVVELESASIVHRDIKPDNIIFEASSSSFWLIDFGIAKDFNRTSLTNSGNLGPHTAGYSAPEQFRNIKRDLDSRCDLFSIGVVAYFVFSGRHPFIEGARDYFDILDRTQNHLPPALAIADEPSGQLSKFIQVLVEKYPTKRPPTAKFALNWFEGIIGNRQE